MCTRVTILPDVWDTLLVGLKFNGNREKTCIYEKNITAPLALGWRCHCYFSAQTWIDINALDDYRRILDLFHDDLRDY